MIEILLGRNDVNHNKPDKYGTTPLCWAAYNGHEGVVKTILRRDDINPNNTDVDGETPLFWAAYHGYEGVVKVLLGRDDVEPDKPDNRGQTPLRFKYSSSYGIAEHGPCFTDPGIRWSTELSSLCRHSSVLL